jgi:hypothetical protein
MGGVVVAKLAVVKLPMAKHSAAAAKRFNIRGEATALMDDFIQFLVNMMIM